MSDEPARTATSIVVAGAGVPGLVLALALKQALGPALAVIVADPGLARSAAADGRAYAVAASGRAMLEALGIWPALAGAAEPMLAMRITDSRGHDAVRPVFLSFDGEIEPGRPFAHMVENGALVAALRLACEAAGVDLRAGAVASCEADAWSARIGFRNGEALDAALLVAADGARSRLREAAGIGWVGWGYGQSGLVATIGHEKPHRGVAIQHFLPAGPFAVLPLGDGGRLGHRSSLVWTERTADAAALMALDDADLLDEIEQRFGLGLGALTLEERPSAHPLGFGIARAFVAERLALLGDAAHVIHPLAGQGLNLGLKDAAALAETIVDAVRLGLDPGTADVLARYQRARRADTVAMGLVTDGLNRLFSTDSTPLRLARDLGLGLVDRLPGLKRLFMREAAGVAGSPGRLMRGERP